MIRLATNSSRIRSALVLHERGGGGGVVRRRRWSSSSSSSSQNKPPAHKAPPSSSAPPTTTRPVPILSVAVGTLAGLLGSLAGMGGGFVMIPLMTSRRVGIGLTQHAAHGTSLFAVAATGVAGALSYGGGVVQYPEAAAVALTATVTARWGARAAARLTGRNLKRLLGWLMLAMAPAVPAKAYYMQRLEQEQQRNKLREQGETKVVAWLEEQQQQKTSKARTATLSDKTTEQLQNDNSNSNSKDKDWFLYARQHLWAPSLIGVGSGYLAGLFGVGGGTLVVPALAVCTDMNHHQALATSLAAMIVPAVAGTVTHYRAGNCALAVAPFLAAGALLGAALGAQVSLHTNEAWLRWGFSGLLATLGVRTLLKS